VKGLAAVIIVSLVQPAAARVLKVGAGQAYPVPSAASAAAGDGDTVLIDPGTYFDCALWHANRLTIAGTGPGVVITDRTCAGKAAFVISGDDVTVRGIVFTRMRVPDGNGAGIRAEGTNLTVRDSRFINDQVGILAGGSAGELRIIGCIFSANGFSLDGRPTHAVLAGPLELLRIEDSTFDSARGGDHILSYAQRTELVGNQLTDEGGAMEGPMVTVNGGSLLFDSNNVSLAPGAALRPGAVLVVGDTRGILARGNTLVEPSGSVPLLRNWTGRAAIDDRNIMPEGIPAVTDSGSAYHRLRADLATIRDEAQALLAAARHVAGTLARRFRLTQ